MQQIIFIYYLLLNILQRITVLINRLLVLIKENNIPGKQNIQEVRIGSVKRKSKIHFKKLKNQKLAILT